MIFRMKLKYNIFHENQNFLSLKSVLTFYFTTLFGGWTIHFDNTLNLY